MHQDLTEVVMEGLLTCDSLLPEDKNRIVLDGILEQRWDLVVTRYPTASNNTEDSFLTYRRMFLVLLKSSRKLQQCLPESSRLRIKKMMLQTKAEEELHDLVFQILERLCGVDVQTQIKQDVSDGRYYRLLWPDRLECEDVITRRVLERHDVTTTTERLEEEEDRKLPTVIAPASPMVFGSVLLPNDLSSSSSHRQQDCCPICLDPLQAPALQLSCQHAFCSQCITNWIRQNQPVMASGNTVCSTDNKWHCPVCRQVYDISD